MDEFEYIEESGIDEDAEESDLDFDPEFVADFLKSQFVEYIYNALEKQELSKASFAEKLNKSRQYVGKVLNETANFTIESMVAISCALGMNLKIEFSKPIEISLPQKIYEFIVQPVNNMIDKSFVIDYSKPPKEILENECNKARCSAA